MAKKRGGGAKPDMLTRTAQITSFSATVRTSAVHRRGEEPDIESQPWLELRGQLDEPVRDASAVQISMYPRDPQVVGTARPASVGAIVGARQALDIVLTWSHAEFDRVWAMTMAGQLTFAHLYFTRPHYNRGLVVSASFSSEREE